MSGIELLIVRLIGAVLLAMIIYYQWQVSPKYTWPAIYIILAAAGLSMLTHLFPIASNIHESITLFMDVILVIFLRYLSQKE